MTYLTPHFTMEDVTKSTVAKNLNIDNSLPTSMMVTIRSTANQMETVRASLNNSPILINSWYRSPGLNRAVGSKGTSQHLRGEAVDFTCPGFGTPLEICKHLESLADYVNFDQLILEHTWVHISFSIPSESCKHQVLSLLSTGGYAVGLTDTDGSPY